MAVRWTTRKWLCGKSAEHVGIYGLKMGAPATGGPRLELRAWPTGYRSAQRVTRSDDPRRREWRRRARSRAKRGIRSTAARRPGDPSSRARRTLLDHRRRDLYADRGFGAGNAGIRSARAGKGTGNGAQHGGEDQRQFHRRRTQVGGRRRSMADAPARWLQERPPDLGHGQPLHRRLRRGAVRYALELAFRRRLVHCRTCQLNSRAPAMVFASVPASHLVFTTRRRQGEDVQVEAASATACSAPTAARPC